MKGEDVFFLVVILVLCIIVGVTFSYKIAHTTGYMHGAKTTVLYYETVGEFPTQDWLETYEGNHFIYTEEVIETLKPIK